MISFLCPLALFRHCQRLDSFEHYRSHNPLKSTKSLLSVLGPIINIYYESLDHWVYFQKIYPELTISSKPNDWHLLSVPWSLKWSFLIIQCIHSELTINSRSNDQLQLLVPQSLEWSSSIIGSTFNISTWSLLSVLGSMINIYYQSLDGLPRSLDLLSAYLLRAYYQFWVQWSTLTISPSIIGMIFLDHYIHF